MTSIPSHKQEIFGIRRRDIVFQKIENVNKGVFRCTGGTQRICHISRRRYQYLMTKGGSAFENKLRRAYKIIICRKWYVSYCY